MGKKTFPTLTMRTACEFLLAKLPFPLCIFILSRAFYRLFSFDRFFFAFPFILFVNSILPSRLSRTFRQNVAWDLWSSSPWPAGPGSSQTQSWMWSESISECYIRGQILSPWLGDIVNQRKDIYREHSGPASGPASLAGRKWTSQESFVGDGSFRVFPMHCAFSPEWNIRQLEYTYIVSTPSTVTS